MTAALFVETAVRAALVLAAAWLAARALRGGAAATRHLIWSLALAGTLVLPAAMALLPAWRVLPAPERSAEALRHNGQLRSTEALRNPSASGSSQAAANDSGTLRGAAVAQRGAVVAQRFSAAFLLLWAAGAVMLLARAVFGIRAVRRLARRARPADRRWRALLTKIGGQTGAPPHVRLLVSPDIAIPMTWGSRRPLLLLPPDAAGWTDDRARVVLLHEIAHIQRADWLTHIIGRAAVALYWFNPLAWIALTALTRERERACDDFVLAHGALATDYAQHLLDIARAGASGAAFAVAPAMARPSEIEGRLLAILTPRRRASGRAAQIGIPLLAAAATALAAVGAATAPADGAWAADLQVGPIAPATPREPLSEVPVFTPSERPAPPAPVSPLAAALRDRSSNVREKAALLMALRSGDDVVEPLLGALKDPSPQVREKAAIGLFLRRQPRVVDALLDAMDDEDAQVREKVTLALGLSGDPRSVPALTQAMADPDPRVREKAATMLALRAPGAR